MLSTVMTQEEVVNFKGDQKVFLKQRKEYSNFM